MGEHALESSIVRLMAEHNETLRKAVFVPAPEGMIVHPLRSGMSKVNYHDVKAAKACPDQVRTESDQAFLRGMADKLGEIIRYWTDAYGQGQLTVYYPADTFCGVVAHNLGLSVERDGSNGGEYMVYRTFFEFEWGMMLKREDMIARVCNIETGTGIANGFTHNPVIDALTELWQKQGTVMYCNRKVIGQIEKWAVNRPTVWHTAMNPGGFEQRSFRGHPVKMVEQLLPTEALVA